MDERELLELAAKAAGIEVRFVSTISGDYRHNLGELPYTHKPHQRADELKRFSDWSIQWNPLKDYGDALRLAVKLHISLEFWERPTADIAGRALFGGNCVVFIGTTEDSVCLAIVRAAAEIGKAMP